MLYSQSISSNIQPASKWMSTDWLSPNLTLYYITRQEINIVHVAFAAWPHFAGILLKSPSFPSAKPQGLPRAQPSACACVQIIWRKGKFGLSTGIARDKLPGTQNHRLKKPGSQLEATPLGPRVTPLHNIVLNATVKMVSKQGLTKPQITFFYAALLCLEHTEHTEIYS